MNILGVVGWTLAGGVPLLFLAVFFAWPAGALIARGFVADGRLTLDGFVSVFSAPRTWRILTQTLAVPPTPEPGAAPARVQVVLEYSVMKKGT